MQTRWQTLVTLGLAIAMLMPLGAALIPLTDTPVALAAPAPLDAFQAYEHFRTSLAGRETLPDLTQALLPMEPDVARFLASPVSQGPGVLSTHTVPVGTTENLAGTVHITEDWDIFGTVNAVNANLIFDGNYVLRVKNTGAFLMSGASSIADGDSDPLTGGVITGTGVINIQGTASVPIPVRSTTVVSVPKGDGLANMADFIVRFTQFSGAQISISTNNSRAIIEKNTFSNTDRGVSVIAKGKGNAGASNVTINDNNFLGTEMGVRIQTGASANVHHNEFRVNVFGVNCNGAAGTGIPQPVIKQNNFRNHYAEAYTGLVGVSVAGTQVVADSGCLVDGNYFGPTETQFKGGADTIQNNAASPIANAAPANPLAATIVTTTTTLNNPTLTGPLITDEAGVLTITGSLNANGFFWGSGTGGRLIANGLTLTNNGMLVIRNDNDQVNNLRVSGNGRHLPVIPASDTVVNSQHAYQYRNSATLDGWIADNFEVLIAAYSGQLVDTGSTYTPTFSHARATNGVIAFFSSGVQATISNGVFDRVLGDLNNYASMRVQLSAVTVTNTVATNMTRGFFGVINGYTGSGNQFRGYNHAVEVQLQGITSSNDVFDGGAVAIPTILATGVTVSNALFASNRNAILSAADASYSVTGSTFAYNAYGVSAIADPITVTNSNFRDNYIYSMMAGPNDVAGTGAFTPGSVTCNNCYFYRADDRSISNSPNNNGVVTIGLTAASPNSAPSPSWLADVITADAGETKTVPAGPLKAPAISRGGGRLVVDGVTVDGASRFGIGAKNGVGGTSGRLTVNNSELARMAFVAVYSTDATIRNNVFSNYDTGVSASGPGITLECNQFQNMGTSVAWERQIGATPLSFLRNRLTASLGVTAGYPYSTTDAQDTVLTSNSADATSDALYLRYDQGHVEMHNNNLLQAHNPADLTDASHTAMADLTNNGYDLTPDAPQVQGNWWGHVGGPTVVLYDYAALAVEPVALYNGGGSMIEVIDPNGYVTDVAPRPIWNSTLSAPAVMVPCAAIRLNTANPVESLPVSVSANAFDPSGGDVTNYAWNFGDGFTVSGASPDASHVYADGGSYTVSLTITAANGQTASASRSIAVAHLNPVANFAFGVVDELSPVTFTDQSSHPNPSDAPPTGWVYAWNFNGEASSAARSPSYRFADGGSKAVTLTVTDNDGKTHAVTKTVVVPHVAPLAGFTFSPNNPLESDTVQFTDQSSHPNAPTDSIATRAWSCTDGFTSSVQNPSHRFVNGGSYTCSLTVSDNDGQSSSVSKPITVAQVGPIAAFVYSPNNPLESQTVQFTDQSSHPNAPNDGIASRLLACTDGFSSSATSPSHKFTDGGSYSCTLTVTDGDGLTSSVTRSIDVASQDPVAAFSAQIVNPGQVQFTDLSTHPNADDAPAAGWTYAWDFNDGSAVDGTRSPFHDFGVTEGVFSVTLTVTDNDGRSSSVTKDVNVTKVNLPPSASFTAPPKGVTGSPVQFTSTSTDPDGTIVSSVWSFGDGGTATGTAPVHTYSAPGDYTVSLTVTDDGGNVASASRVFHVCSPPGRIGPVLGPGARVGLDFDLCLHPIGG